MPKPRKSKPAKVEGRAEAMQRTRESLIEAGMALIGEHGLDVSLDAICERAGFTRGAFYVHFEDRDAFLVAVMDRVGVRFLDAVLGTGESDGDLGQTMERFLGSVQRGEYPLIGRRGVRPHQLLQACARSPKIRGRYVSLVLDSVSRLSSVLRRGQLQKRVRKDVEADAIGTILLAAVIGAQTMMELRVPIDLAYAGGTLLTMLAPAVKK